MKLLNQALVSLLFALALLFTTVPQISAQDQVELPSWEIGWETDMDGVYELELSGEDDILDSIEFFVTNDRMNELNLEISVEWSDSSVPIELEYDESVTVSASENLTFTIEISDITGYSFERSPTDAMTLTLTAEEVMFDQPTSSQEIDAELSVPSVFDLKLDSMSKSETLYSGSSVEYQLTVTNDGNTKDVIKMPDASIKSCPSLSVEGLDALKDVEIDNSTTTDFVIRVAAAESQPERSCEVTISIKSAGNGKIVTTVFDIMVTSNAADDDESSNENNDDSTSQEDNELVESNTLDFLGIYEVLFILTMAMAFRHRK